MTDPDPAPLTEVLSDLAAGLQTLQVDWYLLGALATQMHGVVRSTGDIDVTVRLGSARTRQLLAALRDAGFEAIFTDEEFIESSGLCRSGTAPPGSWSTSSWRALDWRSDSWHALADTRSQAWTCSLPQQRISSS